MKLRKGPIIIFSIKVKGDLSLLKSDFITYQSKLNSHLTQE